MWYFLESARQKDATLEPVLEYARLFLPGNNNSSNDVTEQTNVLY